MQMIIKTAIAISLTTLLVSFNFKPTKTEASKTAKKVSKISNQKIQVAILLDVSNSMDGLIAQAKTQLWNMVNTLGKVKCGNDALPNIEIALYEYGRSVNNVKDGYVKQLKPFTKSLDSLSMLLFNLSTGGGDEYCGQVIYKAIDELNWDKNNDSYKVVFIAGNEDFLQGKLHYSKACEMAKNKGVVVNTIYCGDKQQGIREHWNLQAECGEGSYTNIDANAKEVEIPTPYDTILYALNTNLNNTYIVYGAVGQANSLNQAKQDDNNFKFSVNASVKRVAAKANEASYFNGDWDLVDAKKKDKDFVKKVDRKYLTDSLKNKSTKELEEIIDNNQKTRDSISAKIIYYNNMRNEFLKNKKVTINTPTLETEVEKIIKKQIIKNNMKID